MDATTDDGSAASQRHVDLGIDGYGDAVQIGRGGFAVVYRAFQPKFHREVALKVISMTLDPARVSRFKSECQAIGALSGHPNVVDVYEMGVTGDGRPFIGMEYLPGGSLGDHLAEAGPLEWPQVVEVGIKLAGALAWAHSNGVLHRDVKPDNVLVSRFGGHKLADFGIARVQGRTESQSGAVTATFAYAAPEVLAGQRPTEAADVYSLGSTLFALLAGRAPFVRAGEDSLLPLLARVAAEPAPDLRPQGVPEAVCQVVERALAKDPDRRQANAEACGRELQAAQAAADLPVTGLPLDADRRRQDAASFTLRIPAIDHAATEAVPAAEVAAADRDHHHHRRRRRRPAVLLGLLASVVVGVLALWALTTGAAPTARPLTTAPTPVPSTRQPLVLAQDSFASVSSGWTRVTKEDYSGDYADGQYRMLLKRARASWFVWLRTGDLADVSVEVEAKDVSQGGTMFGPMCRYSGLGGYYYSGRIATNGAWEIYRYTVPAQSKTTLKSGTTRFPTAGSLPGAAYRLRLECSGSNPTVLKLYVNDVKVAETADSQGSQRGQPGLSIEAGSGGGEVLFDNFKVTKLE